MLVFYDFKCSNGHIYEDFVARGTTTSRCKCGANAKKVLTVPNFHLDGSDPSWPTASDKWTREHERKGK